MDFHNDTQSNTIFLDHKRDHKPKRKTINFTNLTIKHLKPKTQRVIYWCEGMKEFGVRISPKGTKTWIYEFRWENKGKRMSLGHYPKVTLSEALKLFSEAKMKVSIGVNPLEERQEGQKMENEALTVSELAEKYIKYCITRGEIAWVEKKRSLYKELLPIIGYRKAKDISFRDIAPIINALDVERDTPVQAQRLLSHARCMFKYAKNSLGVVEINPCADLEAPKRVFKKKRSLDSREIYLFWHNLDYTLMTPMVRLGLRFMLCTMARGIEVRKMRWHDINFSDRTWTIPSSHAKNNVELLLPLNDYAMEILHGMKTITGHSDLVFGHHSTANSGNMQSKYSLSIMGSTAFSHALRDNFELLNIEEKFTPHDLRRTGATCLTSMGYPREWVSKLLNHKSSDVTGQFYDRFDYFEEKKAGMEAIQYILNRILKARNIDEVPSLGSLRREFLSKKLIYQFLEDYNAKDLIVERSSQGLPSSFSSPVTYRLSYDHGKLN